MRSRCVRIFCLLAGFFLMLNPLALQAAPVEKVSQDVRCSVCGMFVAKYDNWIVQAHLADGEVMYFDGVKDMLVFYFNPQQYRPSQQNDINDIWAKDYYTLKWLNAREAIYVIGSDVYGPMGKEFIPFASKEAAENFLQDHKGKKILSFNDITDELVQSMRSGSKMQHGAK